MFNFHKPRVYRSADGCCICRAKSSSSRFTASRKYEKESMQCFNLHEPRNGEICNACVLLVKRYKRLPPDSKRHWGHVVDARAGPGMKSLAKQKKRENESGGDGGSSSSFIPEKFAKIFKKNRKGKITAAAGAKGAGVATGSSTSNAQNTNSRVLPNAEPQASDSNESYEDEEQQQQSAGVVGSSVGGPYQTRKRTAAAAALAKEGGSKRRRQLLPPKKNRRSVDNVPFFEEGDLIRMEICCGTIFQSLALGNGCYIINTEFYKPCEKHLRKVSQVENANTTQSHQQQDQNLQQPEQPMKVLKKHHLFFKRQSESFPQGDIHRISPIPLNKTEARPSTTSGHSTVEETVASTSATTSSSTILSAGSITTTTAIGAASPSSLSSSSNCSTSSSVATKFNDNSSDSGFDEHVLEGRKSISPPTQDEHKSRVSSSTSTSGIQRLVLASGLPITGQRQNLVLAGNEFSARFVQQRQQEQQRRQEHEQMQQHKQQQQQQQQEQPSTSARGALEGAVKINVLGGSQAVGNSNNINKMRAIFNNAVSSSNATIQHENGVTTILPASSLAASNQTAAMNAIVPSMVTITPAKKLSHQLITTNNNSNSSTNTNSTTTTLVTNPKFILLKSAKFVNHQATSSTAAAAAAAAPGPAVAVAAAPAILPDAKIV